MFLGGRYLTGGDLIVHVVERDGPAPPVVLVHGLGGSHLNWSQMAGRLEHRSIALDLPGFGLSPPGRHHDLDSHAAAVEMVIEQLGERVALVGNSLGGLVSLLVSSRRPDLVDRLVLFAPAVPLPPGVMPADPGLLARLGLQSLPGLGPLLAALIRRRLTPARLVDEALRIVTADPATVTPEMRERAVELTTLRSTYPWAARAFAESAAAGRRLLLRPREYERIVSAVEAPVLVVTGSEDRVVTPRAVVRLVDRHPRFELKILDGVGHVPSMEAPATTAALVDSFVSS